MTKPKEAGNGGGPRPLHLSQFFTQNNELISRSPPLKGTLHEKLSFDLVINKKTAIVSGVS
jgi:hypothetical protein